MVESFLNDNLHCLLQGFHRSFKKLCASQLHAAMWLIHRNAMATNRWRVICDRQLITCKRYVFIDFSSSKLKKEPACLDRLGDIVGEEIALFEPHVSKYFVRLRAMRRKSYEMHQYTKGPPNITHTSRYHTYILSLNAST